MVKTLDDIAESAGNAAVSTSKFQTVLGDTGRILRHSLIPLSGVAAGLGTVFQQLVNTAQAAGYTSARFRAVNRDLYRSRLAFSRTAVEGITPALESLNWLLETFNKLPGPIKTGTISFFAFAAGIAAIFSPIALFTGYGIPLIITLLKMRAGMKLAEAATFGLRLAFPSLSLATILQSQENIKLSGSQTTAAATAKAQASSNAMVAASARVTAGATNMQSIANLGLSQSARAAAASNAALGASGALAAKGAATSAVATGVAATGFAGLAARAGGLLVALGPLGIKLALIGGAAYGVYSLVKALRSLKTANDGYNTSIGQTANIQGSGKGQAPWLPEANTIPHFPDPQGGPPVSGEDLYKHYDAMSVEIARILGTLPADFEAWWINPNLYTLPDGTTIDTRDLQRSLEEEPPGLKPWWYTFVDWKKSLDTEGLDTVTKSLSAKLSNIVPTATLTEYFSEEFGYPDWWGILNVEAFDTQVAYFSERFAEMLPTPSFTEYLAEEFGYPEWWNILNVESFDAQVAHFAAKFAELAPTPSFTEYVTEQFGYPDWWGILNVERFDAAVAHIQAAIASLPSTPTLSDYYRETAEQEGLGTPTVQPNAPDTWRASEQVRQNINSQHPNALGRSAGGTTLVDNRRTTLMVSLTGEENSRDTADKVVKAVRNAINDGGLEGQLVFTA